MIDSSYLRRHPPIAIYGGRCALGLRDTASAVIEIADGRITRIDRASSSGSDCAPGSLAIDLAGFLVMPGLINSHDHLEFALYPRLGDPPYSNYIEWGSDIHKRFPAVIARHHAVPKPLRLWWGGIRNLLCGATTVGHHNPLWPEMQRKDFPVKVVQEYGWGHSLALGGDLRTARSLTPQHSAFIVHACEGVDVTAREELWGLDRMALLDANTVLVHGLAIDHEGVALVRERKASLIICPSSNSFLFEKLPDLSLLSTIEHLTLGNDSPLTAEGDLLDEVRFAVQCCNLLPDKAYQMVTEAPAAILRLNDGRGAITVSGPGDLIAVRDTDQDAPDRLQSLSRVDVEFVMIGGRVQLASESIIERLPLEALQGMEPITVDGATRWLRAPVKELLQNTEAILGRNNVSLGGQQLSIPRWC